MRVKINSEAELLTFAASAFHLMVNLRHWERKAQSAFYTKGREQLKRWQKEADEFIKSVNLEFAEDRSKTFIDKENDIPGKTKRSTVAAQKA